LFKIFHEPFEDFDVTMHTYVNVINACRFSQILLKVLHMRNEKFLLAGEVLIDLAVFVEHVNDNYLLLLLAAPCLLEAVMNAALAADGIAAAQIVGGTLPHSTAGLLFL
jgi:hypothetical protein